MKHQEIKIMVIWDVTALWQVSTNTVEEHQCLATKQHTVVSPLRSSVL